MSYGIAVVVVASRSKKEADEMNTLLKGKKIEEEE
jgi:hypothetical protein